MAGPTAMAMVCNVQKSVGENGACREYWLRFPGLSAASDCDAAAVLYYIENPFHEDLVVLTALAVITTLDANDGDIDVGLADDAAGTNIGAEIFDSIVNTAAGIFEGTIPQAVAGTGAKPIWKAKGTATDAFLCVYQNADADVAALRWNLYIKVIPYADLIGGDTLDAITVA